MTRLDYHHDLSGHHDGPTITQMHPGTTQMCSDNTRAISSPAAPLIPVLLVDDDADCRLLMRDALSICEVPCIVYEVADGAEALEFLYRRGAYRDMPHPSLIYMDMQMPRLDGLSTLKQIRTDPSLATIPIVMMSAVDDEMLIRRAAELGASSYNVKSNDAETFLRTAVVSTQYWLTIHRHPQHCIVPAHKNSQKS